jgi:hypothetical protein
MRGNRWLILVLVWGLGGLLPGGAMAQDWHPMTYSADAPGIDENPLRGLVPYSFAPQGGFPHSMEWFYMPLSALVVGQDTYDWRPVEKELAKIAARGDQAALRFYLDFPGKPPAIPRYLLAAGLKTFAYDDFDNGTSLTRSRAPDQSDPRLIQCLLHFIRAFGARYDGDPRIGYVTAGLVGFWGEWHVTGHPKPGEDPGWAMAQEDKDAILVAYRESFRKTMVLVRYPTVTQRANLLDTFGFHDDSFGNDTLGSEVWQFRRQLTMANAIDHWKTHATGGEVYPQLQPRLWDAWPNPVGEDVTAALALTHATWMLDEGLFEHGATPAEKANALRAHRMMGYALVCSEAKLARDADGALTISVRLENRGIAPFYAAWPVEVEAVDGSAIVADGQANWPLASLLPGEHAEYMASFQDFPQHGATVVMRVVNPLPNGHPVVFANAEMGTVKKGWLTLGKIAASQ